MSCGLAIVAALLFSDPNVVATAAVAPVAEDAPVSVAGEPLFTDIVNRSRTLKAIVDGWVAAHAADGPGFLTETGFSAFKDQAVELAALDMQAHVVLRDRGVDGDLKCILRGISEDMPRKIEAVETATTPQARAVALSELAYLLNDNDEVITAPPQPEV